MGKLSALYSENTRGEEGYESFFRRLDCIRVLIVVAAITLAVATFNLVINFFEAPNVGFDGNEIISTHFIF